MKKIFLLFILISLGLLAVCQNEKTYIITGFTLNIENLTPVQLANIATTSSNKKFISNRNGSFKIDVRKDDSIKISAIGFSTVILSANKFIDKNLNDSLIILLTPQTYQLKDVVVKSNLIRDSIARLVALILMHDTLLNNYDRIYNRPKGEITFNKNYTQPGIIYIGPITDLYNKFSKEGKDDISFEEFVKYALQQKKVDDRYNKKLVKKITHIDDNQLEELMMYCKLEREFIINASDYDLIDTIKKCGENFKKRLR